MYWPKLQWRCESWSEWLRAWNLEKSCLRWNDVFWRYPPWSLSFQRKNLSLQTGDSENSIFSYLNFSLFDFDESHFSWPYHYKEGENETSIFMEGRWTKVPKNPARHLRGLSSHYLKHATWTLARFKRTVLLDQFINQS